MNEVYLLKELYQLKEEIHCKNLDNREISIKLNRIFSKVTDPYLKLREDVIELVTSMYEQNDINPDSYLEPQLNKQANICTIKNSNRLGRMEPVKENIKNIRFLNGNLNYNVFEENDYEAFHKMVNNINEVDSFVLVSPVKTASSFKQLIQRLGKKDNSKRFSGFVLESNWFYHYYYPFDLDRAVEQFALPSHHLSLNDCGTWEIKNGKFLFVDKQKNKIKFSKELEPTIFVKHDPNGKIVCYSKGAGDGYVTVAIVPAKYIQKEIFELNMIKYPDDDYILDGFFECEDEIYYFMYFVYTG